MSWKYEGDPSGVLSLTSTLRIPQNIAADFKKMQITPAASLTDAPLAQIVGTNGSRDFGVIDGLYLFQPLANGVPDESRNVDGLTFGNGSDYVRQCAIRNPVVRGFRDIVQFVGSNNYIWDITDFLFSKGWRRGVYYNCPTNSGERMSFGHGTIGDIGNAAGDAIALYIDPAATASPWFNLDHVSVDYSDRTCVITHGELTATSCHFENNNNNPYVELIRTAGRKPPAFKMTSGVMLHGNGGNAAAYASKELEALPGRPAYIRVTGAGATINLAGPSIGEFETNARVTQIWMTTTPLSPVNAIISTHQDAGQVPSKGAGTGIPFATSFNQSDVYNDAVQTNFLNGWTTIGTPTWSVNTTDFLPGELASRQVASASAASGQNYQILTLGAGAGGNVTVETYVHVASLTAGSAALRITGANDAAIAGSMNTFDNITTGMTTVSPISSAGATIGAPNAFGTAIFTPGATQQGAFAVGQFLSGAGVTAGTYVTADNGNGTYKVFNPGAAVAATTIRGWTKVSSRHPIPAGTKFIRVSEFGNGINGTALFSRTRAWVER